MERQKRWQFYLILTVMILTLYNILPTVFYYTKPLKSPIEESQALGVSNGIITRVNSLEADGQAWLKSFAKLLGIKPTSISLTENDASLYEISFANEHDAQLFKRFLPQAGATIPFIPAQLALYQEHSINDPRTVLVERRLGIQLNPDDVNSIFHFSNKFEKNGSPTPFYRSLINERALQLALGFGGSSRYGRQVSLVVDNASDPAYNDLTVTIAREIVDIDTYLGKNPSLKQRLYASFSQVDVPKRESLIPRLLAQFESLHKNITKQKDQILAEQKKLEQDSQFLNANKLHQLAIFDSQLTALESARTLVKKYQKDFNSGIAPLNFETAQQLISQSTSQDVDGANLQHINLKGFNPYFESLTIDWATDQISINPYVDVQELLGSASNTEAQDYAKEKLQSLLINEIAQVSQTSDETITPKGEEFTINLNQLTNSSSLLAIDLGYIAEKQSQQIINELSQTWTPKHVDLIREHYPIRDFANYRSSSPEEQKLGLVIYAPALSKEDVLPGFRRNSIYVIAKGLDSIIQKAKDVPNAEENQTLNTDFNALMSFLQQKGFIGYSGSSYGLAPEFSKDYIFEMNDYYGPLLLATRENFSVKGEKQYAVLEFTDYEQRLLTENHIGNRIQEDLLKWHEEYRAAQTDLNSASKYTVPAPTKNVYWQNFKLSFNKYFRGDDRKILKWGLDLSGGKTVRIGLKDQNNQPVTNPEDLNQAVNELYTRINKMGVSERTIRIENQNIILDFPGSQALTASDLIKASAMYFHIVNEKFSPNNQELSSYINQFLQEVWNEAIVTNRKDSDNINIIAWEHLGGEEAMLNGQALRPISEAAQILLDNGLRLQDPKKRTVSSAFNDTLSSIAIYRGDDSSAWYGQNHPLLFVFHNFALEGSSLENIQVGFDPTQGNILMFGVKKSYGGANKGKGSPREDFYTWTSQFAKEKIVGTPKEAYTHGHGWRMAVILNGTVISSPVLEAALSNQATISGRFSQREINQLASDLKAGSLSFTPRILSEQNVSPELGKEERTRGISAAILGMFLVIAAMIGYYHFAGLVASAAVIFNLLIMWGVLQNLDAALTLPGIAAMVLTIATAVDANVLVFERVREEFKISNRIGSAIQAGYRKAFSAIVDSNVTTIIAALILIQFDSGPIKGFAVTLIVGIISSMFTALFMTRYFFAGWVQNPNHRSLSMSQFISSSNFDFLGKTRIAVILSIILMIIGGFYLFNQRHTIFGMDFTGGYSLTVQTEEKPNTDYRLVAKEALLAEGALPGDVEVRELTRPNQLRIQLSVGMEQPGHPFYGLPLTIEERGVEGYHRNPRIEWVVTALEKHGLNIPKYQLDLLESNWTAMSGQFSDAMRNNAILALAIAVFSMLVYITIRFEFKYAVGAVVGLLHDVFLTIGILAILHRFGLHVQIDLQVVGAIMMIIGYSLNDTIIVFDRIREDIKILRKMKFRDIVNHALNVTLARTIMTSGTTLLVLLALVFIGGSTIFAFSLIMAIGVIVGTLSSLFIAAPIMLYFHDREERQQLTQKMDLKKVSFSGISQ